MKMGTILPLFGGAIMKERQRWIDFAKGICMLAVVACHTESQNFGFVFSFHLTVFFILSGYTLRQEPITKAYVKNKFARLMVPYFITCAAVVAMDVVNAVVVNNNFTIAGATEVLYEGIIKTFFASGGPRNLGAIDMGKGIGAIWFLPAMFFSLLITQALLNGITDKKMQALGAVMIAALAAALAQVVWLPFSVLSGAFAVPFIWFGLQLKERKVLEEKLKWWHYLIFGGIFWLGCLSGYAQKFYMVSCFMGNWLITPLCALCSSLALIGLCRLIKNCKPLEFLGKHSLIVLCVHLFEMNTLYDLYRRAFDWLGMEVDSYIKLAMRIVVICVITHGLVGWKKWHKKPEILRQKRDAGMDILRSILLALLILGNNVIDKGLRNWIYSFHMMALIMSFGYYASADGSFRENMKKTVKILLPYGVFAALYVLVQTEDFLAELTTLASGLSGTKLWLCDVPTVGPMFLIPLLFITKLLYSIVALCKKEWLKNALVLMLLFGGLWLGERGAWLPWSVDLALVCLLFYHIAHCMRTYQVLEKSRENPWLYFPLVFLWWLMQWSGAMELTVRQYMDIGISVLGVCGAFIVLYMLCSYLSSNLPRWMAKLSALVGQSTASILIVHTLFADEIGSFLSDTLGLTSTNVYYLVATIAFQLLVGTACFLAFIGLTKVANGLRKLPAKA